MVDGEWSMVNSSRIAGCQGPGKGNRVAGSVFAFGLRLLAFGCIPTAYSLLPSASYGATNLSPAALQTGSGFAVFSAELPVLFVQAILYIAQSSFYRVCYLFFVAA